MQFDSCVGVLEFSFTSIRAPTTQGDWKYYGILNHGRSQKITSRDAFGLPANYCLSSQVLLRKEVNDTKEYIHITLVVSIDRYISFSKLISPQISVTGLEEWPDPTKPGSFSFLKAFSICETITIRIMQYR